MSQLHHFEVDGDQVNIHLVGDLLGDRAAIFREKTLQYIEQGFQHFTVNLEAVDDINSTGLGALVNIQKRIRQNGGHVTLHGLQGSVRTAFQRTRLHKAFSITETPETPLS
ncbi:MAG TPA: STAS domain-containing protein [Patescibacteria group bacterium]|nr:STAS domain-containing protein [Patescibacteria group bacterium]